MKPAIGVFLQGARGIGDNFVKARALCLEEECQSFHARDRGSKLAAKPKGVCDHHIVADHTF
jgi:hypothetical protein